MSGAKYPMDIRFDRRLVKDELIEMQKNQADVRNTERSDYRQFMPSNPWTTDYTNPPLGHNYHHAINVGSTRSNFYQSLAASNVPVNCGRDTFTAAPNRPLIFPNLVANFDRDPSQAARHALYTRPTPADWSRSCVNAYADSDVTRSHAERLRSDAVRLIRQTDERTAQVQRDAGHRLGERLGDVAFWRNELATELERLLAEQATLADTRRKAAKALDDLTAPLRVAQECMYHREARQSVERVHDEVERGLLAEVDRLRSAQSQLTACLRQIDGQLADMRAVQHELQLDVQGKESTLGIDTVCHRMTNATNGLQFYAGIERFDPTVSSIDSWAQATSKRVNISQSERGKSAQLRSNTDTLINQIATAVWENWNQSNSALNRRASELAEAKNRYQLHLQRIAQEMFDVQRNIDQLHRAIESKTRPLQVAQTRLQARSQRVGLELCRDVPHECLVQEVQTIQQSIAELREKLADAEAQHQQLVHTKAKLESDLHRKIDALHIDREKCMGLRRSFPVDCLIKY